MKRFIKNLDELKKFSHEIEKNVFGFSNILIYGDIGAGKTTFTKFFLENIGVEKKIKSPSYALENFYEIKNSKKFGKIWHYDIYRLENQYLESLESNFEGDDLVIIERAEKLEKKPQSGIELHFKKISKTEREIEIKFFGTSFSEEQIKKIFEKYKTPINIQGHTAQVANTAIQVTENFLKNGKILDKKLIYTAARLHDVIKYIDFVEKIEPVKGKYFDIPGNQIPIETIDFWKKIKKQFSGLTHEKAGDKLFYDMGYKEIGKIIKSHGLLQVFEGFGTREEKIVFYGDMRTVHHETVSVKERIKDIKERYGNLGQDDDNLYEKLLKMNLKIEKDLTEI